MLVVKTKVKRSKIHGRGLFANQNIKKGQVIWIFSPSLDKKFSGERLSQLSPSVQKHVKYYSYLNDKDEFVLCGDDAKYMNHSDNPNTEDILTLWNRFLGREAITIASQEIKRGEELTSKYLRFNKKGRARLL